MDCKQCTEELTAFLDGELRNADSERVRSHLHICDSCSEELRSLQEAGDFINSHNHTLDPRPESWNMVRARIYQADPATPSRFRIFGHWRLALAALGLIAAFAFTYSQYQQVQQRDLDNYISRYEQERKTLINSSADSYNPFIQIKATVDKNPFRSEDR